MAQQWFVSAIGTNIGKTFISAALCYQAAQAGIRLRAIKPIASGVDAASPHSDAAVLAQAQGLAVSPEMACAQLTHTLFTEYTAPDTAAANAHRDVAWQEIIGFCERHQHVPTPLLVEGAGGLYTPLTAHRSNADLVAALDIPIVLVTGTYLGAISQTIATLRAAKADGLSVCAMVISQSNEEGAQSTETVLASLQRLAANDMPAQVVCVPRVSDAHGEVWRHVPNLLGVLGLAQ